MNSNTNPIWEGVVIKCAEYGIENRYVNAIYEATLQRNPDLKRALGGN